MSTHHIADMHLADMQLADEQLADEQLAFKGMLECMPISMHSHPMEHLSCPVAHVDISMIENMQVHSDYPWGSTYRGMQGHRMLHLKQIRDIYVNYPLMQNVAEWKRRYFINLVCIIKNTQQSRHSGITYTMLCTRYMQYGSLQAFMARALKLHVTIPTVTRLSLAAQCVRAVAVLHHNTKQHSGKIELENFYLDNNMCVIMQGLWKTEPARHATINTTVRRTTTMAYMAPELFLLHNHSQKSDVYALGVVLLDLLSGVPAFNMHNIKSENAIFHEHGRTRAKLNVSTNDATMAANRCGMELLESAHRELILQMLHDSKTCRPTALEVYQRLAPEVYEANRGIFSC